MSYFREARSRAEDAQGAVEDIIAYCDDALYEVESLQTDSELTEEVLSESIEAALFALDNATQAERRARDRLLEARRALTEGAA